VSNRVRHAPDAIGPFGTQQAGAEERLGRARRVGEMIGRTHGPMLRARPVRGDV